MRDVCVCSLSTFCVFLLFVLTDYRLFSLKSHCVRYSRPNIPLDEFQLSARLYFVILVVVYTVHTGKQIRKVQVAK